MKIPLLPLLSLLGISLLHVSGAETPARITIISDAFGAPSELERGWGFSALIEYGGKRVLFDAGSKVAAFERNVKRLNVDLARLDAVIISHRHSDHTAGLATVLKVNPTVKIYTPSEVAFFKGTVPKAFFAPQPELPAAMRYFGGHPPAQYSSDTPWGEGNFINVDDPTEILPGFFVFAAESTKPGTVELNEVSLAIRTPRGLAVVVGCSHPGIEKILGEAAKIDAQLYTVARGFHLVMTPRAEVTRIATALHDQFKLSRVAPGHCTSELGFVVFRQIFGDHFDEAGVGAVIPLP